MNTPITYWGGKQQLTPVILGMIPEHKAYDEPFLGGGAVLFAKRPSPREYVSDINASMINFYQVLKNDYAALKKMIDDSLHAEYSQKEAKRIFKEGHENKVRWAWAVYIMSKQSKYAMMDGHWEVSMQENSAKRFNDVKKQFREHYALRLEHVSLFCRDAIDQIKATDSIETFHYCDPPYYNSDCAHYSGYSIDDYKELLDTLAEVKGKFLLSSYPSDILQEYTDKYNWRCLKLEMTKSAGGKGKKKVEVLTYNYDADRDKQQCLFDF